MKIIKLITENTLKNNFFQVKLDKKTPSLLKFACNRVILCANIVFVIKRIILYGTT